MKPVYKRLLLKLSGEALMGKKKSDEFEFETPVGKRKYKVLKEIVMRG